MLGGRNIRVARDRQRERRALAAGVDFHTGDVSDGTRWPTRSAFETTPLVVDGVMYLTTPFSRLIALDPETGRELTTAAPRAMSARRQRPPLHSWSGPSVVRLERQV
jgi:hypothetical protein